jgi:hypothetical protein
MVEKPFATFLSPKNFHTHCYNCLQRSEALLPCSFCSNVSNLHFTLITMTFMCFS